MVEIPINNESVSEKDKLISKIIEYLNANPTSEFVSYRYSDGYALPLVKDVCREFSDKGYHCKIVFFCDGRASYQRFEVSKHYLSESCARAIYSEMY